MAANSPGLFGSNVTKAAPDPFAPKAPKAIHLPDKSGFKIPAQHFTGARPKSFTVKAPMHVSSGALITANKILGIKGSGSSGSGVVDAGTPMAHYSGMSSLLSAEQKAGLALHGGGGSTGGGAATKSGQPSGGGGGLLGGVEGFLGHLANDAATTIRGIPVGLSYMMTHNPIDTAEGVGKATWADWSPLFHGNVGQWAHNTYEHPLAPILDVVGVLSGGAGLAGRAAELAGRVGEATMSAEEAARAADAVAAEAKAAKAVGTVNHPRMFMGVPVGGGKTFAVTDWQQAGQAAGRAGTDASATWQKLLRFGHPARFAARQYGKQADFLGLKGDEAASYVREALNNDLTARRVVAAPSGSGLQKFQDVSRNPWNRITHGMVHNLASDAAKSDLGKTLKLDKIMGPEAIMKRWTKFTVGERRLATRALVIRELSVLTKGGELVGKLTNDELMTLMHPTMRTGLIAQAEVLPKMADEAAQSAALARDGWQFIQADTTANMQRIFDTLKNNPDDASFEKALRQTWAKANTTNNVEHALRDSQGRLLAVSRPERWGQEASNSLATLKKLYTKPTQVWRWMLMGASPRYFVDNFVGNGLMLMGATDPVTTLKALYDTMKLRKATDAEFEAQRAAMISGGASSDEINKMLLGRTLHGGSDFIDRNYAASYASTMSADQMEGLSKVMNKYGLMNVTHKYADMPYRKAAVITTIKRLPEYRQAYADARAAGMGHWDAMEKAGTIASRNPAVRQIVREQVRHMLGNYGTYSKFERGVKQIVPFYGWGRAITRNMYHIVTSAPYKAAMAEQVGRLGLNHSFASQLPDFLLSSASDIPGLNSLVGNGGQGRVNVLNMQNLSPWSTVSDFIQSGAAAADKVTGRPIVGGQEGGLSLGETIGSQLNPIAQGVGQTLFGTNLMTGSPLKPGQDNAVNQIGSQFTNVGPLSLLFGNGASGPDVAGSKGQYQTLYKPSEMKVLSSLLGFPINQVSPSAAQYDYQKEYGIKPPSKRKEYIPGG